MNETLEYEYKYYKVKCGFCGRSILVEHIYEHIYSDVPHTVTILASCKKCLKKNGISEKFKKDHPKEAQDVEQWIQSNVFKYEDEMGIRSFTQEHGRSFIGRGET